MVPANDENLLAFGLAVRIYSESPSYPYRVQNDRLRFNIEHLFGYHGGQVSLARAFTPNNPDCLRYRIGG